MTPLDYTTFEFITRVQKYRDYSMFRDDFVTTLKQFGFFHSMISNVPSPGDRFRPHMLHLAYPTKWVEHYADHNYIAVDPVVRYTRTNADPKIWSRAPAEKGSKGWKMMREAAQFGLSDGIAIPIMNARGLRSIVSVATPHRDSRWDAVRSITLMAICAHYAAQVISENGKTTYEPEELSSREIECIKWLAAGKSRAATADILTISDNTVKFHLNSACQKLGVRTGPQLVVEAFRRGFVN